MTRTGAKCCECHQRLEVVVSVAIADDRLNRLLRQVQCDDCRKRTGAEQLRGFAVRADQRAGWFFHPEPRRSDGTRLPPSDV